MLTREQIGERLRGLVIYEGEGREEPLWLKREREALETAKQLGEWVYWQTRDCSICPRGDGPPGLMCSVPSGKNRPCYASEYEALAWLGEKQS